MKVKTEQLMCNPNICELKIKIPTKSHESKGIEEDIDNSISGRKMMKKSSQLSQAWSLGSLMTITDFPLSPDSFHSSVSPSLHCDDSCRPSTVFYSPRFQDIRYSKQDTKLMNNSKSCKAATNVDSSIRGIVGVKNKGLRSDVNGELKTSNVASTIPIGEEEDSEYKQGNQQFGEPLSEDGTRCRKTKTFQELLEENERSEADTMRKAAYMHMLRKLTSKEEAIDEWESKRRTKAIQQLQKLERKLEQKRAEAVQKMHKKLAETKLEAQRRKANARQSAMKLIAKHNLSRT